MTACYDELRYIPQTFADTLEEILLQYPALCASLGLLVCVRACSSWLGSGFRVSCKFSADTSAVLMTPAASDRKEKPTSIPAASLPTAAVFASDTVDGDSTKVRSCGRKLSFRLCALLPQVYSCPTDKRLHWFCDFMSFTSPSSSSVRLKSHKMPCQLVNGQSSSCLEGSACEAG